MKPEGRLRKRLQEQSEQIHRAKSDQRSLLAQTTFLGTLGLVFVLPVIGGAYLGSWLDTLVGGYSVHWTVICLLLGIVVGAVNAYLLVTRS